MQNFWSNRSARRLGTVFSMCGPICRLPALAGRCQPELALLYGTRNLPESPHNECKASKLSKMIAEDRIHEIMKAVRDVAKGWSGNSLEPEPYKHPRDPPPPKKKTKGTLKQKPSTAPVPTRMRRLRGIIVLGGAYLGYTEGRQIGYPTLLCNMHLFLSHFKNAAQVSSWIRACCRTVPFCLICRY